MTNYGAVAGWVVASMLACFVFLEATTTRSVFHREKYRQEGNRGADRYCLAKPVVPSGNPATPSDANSTDRSEKEKDDLCQQWRMAEAAEDAAVAAWVQLPVSMFGLLLVGLATFYAARSARSAADAAKAAESSVTVTQETAKRQLRAYFALEAGSITLGVTADGNRLLTWHAELKNCGQTPAYEVTTRRKSQPFKASDARRPILHLTDVAIISRSITGAGSSTHLSGQAVLTEPDAEAFKRGDVDIIVKGRVDYADIFREEARWFEFECRKGAQAEEWRWGLGPTETGYQGN